MVTRRFWPAVQAGCAYGLSALAGAPPLTIITGCFLAMWALGRTFSCPSRDREEAFSPLANARGLEYGTLAKLKFAFLALSAVLLTGLAVLAPVYTAFFAEAAGYTERAAALTRDMVVNSNACDALNPGALATFASSSLPLMDFFHRGMWEYTDITMCSIYIGSAVPVLAPLALLLAPKDRWRWWLAGLAALSLSCALGRSLPVRGWLLRFFSTHALFPTRGSFQRLLFVHAGRAGPAGVGRLARGFHR
jgi:hypothetical protein